MSNRKWVQYGKLEKEDFESLSKLHEFAKKNSLSFKIEYSESEDCWEITMSGAGRGEEFFSGKRISYLEDAVGYILKDSEKYYKTLNN